MGVKSVVIIGGGAAGFFAAISCKTHQPDASVTLLEKTDKLLSKVKISGGGRCNVTHACFDNSQLSKFYPRGEKWLQKSFHQFSVKETVEWFESRGVKLKTESDNRMFPVSNHSQTIIDCLVKEAHTQDVKVIVNAPVSSIKREPDHFRLKLRSDKELNADNVIIATGGSPKLEGFKWLHDLGHTIAPSVPSLFTFNLPKEKIRELQGVVAENVSVSIMGTKIKSTGPLLITHWGMSGPAVLRLSAFGARMLHDMSYRYDVRVNWPGEKNEEQAKQLLSEQRKLHASGKVGNKNPFRLPNRLWNYLLERIELNPATHWGALSAKATNRLLNILLNDVYHAEGKTTFKEEFVTCGGISLHEVSPQTMESKVVPGLYFAGEVLDVDGVTGGFNFQAAWTTGFIAGKLSSVSS